MPNRNHSAVIALHHPSRPERDGGVAVGDNPVSELMRQAVAFIAIHQAVFGLYMGCSFAPNHKGMQTVPEGQEIDFLRRQVLTSRNVRGGWFTDLLLGGLTTPEQGLELAGLDEHALRGCLLS